LHPLSEKHLNNGSDVKDKKRERKKTFKKVCGNEKVVVCLPPVSTKGQKREANKIEKVL
jgi:hypothetical protein